MVPILCIRQDLISPCCIHPDLLVPVSAGVLQGSVLEPLRFTVYVSPIARLIESCHIGYHAYADDTQLSTALKASVHDNINELVQCVETLQSLQIWFWHNGLLLYPEKSEVIFSTRQQLHSTDLLASISITGNIIPVSPVIKILGVKVDSMLSFSDRINSVVRASIQLMHALRHIHCYTSRDVARLAAFSIVGS
jgi:Reverse transcriptase (RNA-dependent DNA polymerase)